MTARTAAPQVRQDGHLSPRIRSGTGGASLRVLGFLIWLYSNGASSRTVQVLSWAARGKPLRLLVEERRAVPRCASGGESTTSGGDVDEGDYSFNCLKRPHQ